MLLFDKILTYKNVEFYNIIENSIQIQSITEAETEIETKTQKNRWKKNRNCCLVDDYEKTDPKCCAFKIVDESENYLLLQSSVQCVRDIISFNYESNLQLA